MRASDVDSTTELPSLVSFIGFILVCIAIVTIVLFLRKRDAETYMETHEGRSIAGLACRDGGTFTSKVGGGVSYTLTVDTVDSENSSPWRCAMETYSVRVDHPEGWTPVSVSPAYVLPDTDNLLVRSWQVVFRKPTGDLYSVEIGPWHYLASWSTRIICSGKQCLQPTLEVAP